jgi:nucleoside-diphosphate-sugar epimerase
MRKMPGIPRLSFGIVDVRDVAQAHLLALEHPESNGKRYIIVAESLWMSDMALKLKAEFEKYGYKVPTSLISKCLLRVASIFDSNAKAILPLYGKQMKVDNSKSKIELKIEYRDVSKGMIEMGYDLIKLGAIPNKINKKK